MKKICTKCNTEKDITEFYKSKKEEYYECKSCSKEATAKRNKERRQYFYENKEIILKEHESKSKVCTKCKIEKPFSEFYIRDYTLDYRESRCSLCCNITGKSSELKNREKNEIKRQKEIDLITEKQNKTNTELLCNHCKENKHISEYRVLKFEGGRGNFRSFYCISCESRTGSERNHETYMKNRESKIKKQQEYNKKRYNEDIAYRCLSNLRSRLHTTVLGIGHTKFDSTMNLAGCSREDLVQHLEKQFTEGMVWGKKSKIHIDHIVPCSYFDLSKEGDQRICFHYLNLQPLWKNDNLNKGNNIPVNAEDIINNIKSILNL